jgi:MoxR-like ATPase
MEESTFEFLPRPIFPNIVLADEIKLAFKNVNLEEAAEGV